MSSTEKNEHAKIGTTSVETIGKLEGKEQSPKSSDPNFPDNVHDAATESIADIDIPSDEEIEIDPSIVEKLSTGFLSAFLPELQKGQSVLSEVLQNQQILTESVQQENSKFTECTAMENLSEMMAMTKKYQTKLLNIKKEMSALQDRSLRLKKRALKLQQQKQKEELQRAQQREKEFERERALTAKVAKKSPTPV
ncbi:hypothetical protein ScPMuIL_002620 [Solemya velum]